ncbi:MAG: aminopeptidase P family protein [Phycisphaeraceae bacterium]|nr:aminopeptidase P family protein [Phycisphaeraceae bacterium]MCW5753452.1 aminopeptidase P family protein [Phycisphaeraceae bacterium]
MNLTPPAEYVRRSKAVTIPAMMDTSLRPTEYASRRARVLRALKRGVGIVFAGEGGSLHDRFRPDSSFVYLTGIRDEPGAAVLFDPTNPDPLRRCVLFLKPRNPEMEAWDGFRPPIDAALRKATGFTRIFRTLALPGFLTDALRRSKQACCLHKFAVYDAPASPDLAVFRRVAERVPGVGIVDMSNLLPSLRAVKSSAEQLLIRKAIDATHEGHRSLLAILRPGVNERDLHRALETGWNRKGASGPAYNPIVGGGVNSTVLHYHANDQELHDGDILCVDAAATLGGYAADITRTYPVSGKFSREQRRIYNIVLEAQLAAIQAVRPGAYLHQVDAAARAVIEKAGFGDAYIHGIGHHLGLDVHDATPDGPLRPGNVVTIEPGIYLQNEKIGVRIEDDILVTPSGRRNLSAAIPKAADEVEALIRSLRR